MNFLIALLVIVLLLRLLGYFAPRIIAWMARRQMRKFAERMASGYGARQQSDSSQQSGSSQQSRAQQKKRFDDSYGEYVEFEEIEATTNTETHTHQTSSHTSKNYTNSSQIEDAEWVDL